MEKNLVRTLLDLKIGIRSVFVGSIFIISWFIGSAVVNVSVQRAAFSRFLFMNDTGLSRGEELHIWLVIGIPLMLFFLITDQFSIRILRNLQKLNRENDVYIRRVVISQQAAKLGIWEWNMERDELFWSDNIENLFGISPGTFGRSYDAFLEAVHPLDRDRVSECVDEALKFDRKYEIDHRIITQNGMVRWMRENGTVIRDSQGKPIEMIGIVQDVTDIKYYQNELENLKTCINMSEDGIVVTDDKGVVEYVNPSYEKLTGYDLVGKNVKILKSGWQPDSFYKEMWTTIVSGKTWRGEIVNRTRHGINLIEEMSITPVRQNNGDLKFIAIKQDRTFVKYQEKLLKDKEKETAQYLRHELKNLIQPIQGYSEILKDYANEKLSDQQLELIEAIHKTSRQMIGIITKMKELQDLESGREEVKRERTDWIQNMDSLVGDLNLSQPDGGVRIEHEHGDAQIILEIDRVLVNNALLNLIQNAIEHVTDLQTEEERLIRIKSQLNDDILRVTINNKGPLLKENQVQTFFEKFNSTKENGSGLGTNFAKLVVTLHRGDIAVTSSAEEGITVHMKFPIY